MSPFSMKGHRAQCPGSEPRAVRHAYRGRADAGLSAVRAESLVVRPSSVC